MELVTFPIQGLVEIRFKIFNDERGYFFESYNQLSLEKKGFNWNFVQDNQSFSFKNVLRGLHFQAPPFAQAKLVKVVTGKALDIAVDIRKNSPTFGQHQSVILDSKLNNALYIPEGFAHGFVALEDCIFQYKCSKPYNKDSEVGIIWNDPDLKINWKTDNPIVSAKDQELSFFKQLPYIF